VAAVGEERVRGQEGHDARLACSHTQPRQQTTITISISLLSVSP
jgi:hypothetical protein